jgi:monoamine oxidase
LLERVISAYQQENNKGTICFQEFMERQLSLEAINFIRDASGYDSNFTPCNAHAAIQNICEHEYIGTQDRTVKGGMSKIIESLRQDLDQRNVEILTNAEVTAIEPQGNKCVVHTHDNSWHAASVILAVPPQKIRNIFDQSPTIGTSTDQTIETIQHQEAIKGFFIYPTAQWKVLPISSPKPQTFITDLPLRKIFIPATSHANELVAIMPLYCDMHHCKFWRQFTGKEIGTMPNEMIACIIKMLKQVTGHELPSPQNTIVTAWTQQAAGAAFHTWSKNITWPLNKSNLIKPFSNNPIYYCGEAFSEKQSWIEGALESVEDLMRFHGEEILNQDGI